MKFTIISFNRRKSIRLISACMIVIFGIALLIATTTEVNWVMALTMPLFALAFYVSMGKSTFVSKVTFRDRSIQVDHEYVDYRDIVGYCLNVEAANVHVLEFKLRNGDILAIPSWVNKNRSKNFKLLVNHVAEVVAPSNPEWKNLTYREVHIREMAIMRPAMWGLVGVVLLVDALFLYNWYNGHLDLSTLMVNGVILVCLPYLKK